MALRSSCRIQVFSLLSKMTYYEVQLWNEDEHCVYYHSVKDAIDYEDARDIIQAQYPNQKVISVIRKK